MLFSDKQVLLVKVEATPGTDAAPVIGSDAVLAGLVDISIDKQPLNRLAIRQSLSEAKIVFGRSNATLTIPVELKGSGVVGTAPESGPLFQACAYKETIAAGVSVSYAPTSTVSEHKTVTAWLHIDGLLFKIVGAIGNFENPNPAGGYGALNFTITGRLSSIIDAALPAAPTYDATTPVQLAELGVTLGAWADGVYRNLTIRSGNNIRERASMNGVDGMDVAIVSKRNPTIDFLVEAELEATNPFFANMDARTEQTLTFEIPGAAGNIVTVTAPAFCPSSINPDAEDGIEMYNVAGQAGESAGNDNVTYKFT